MGVFAWILGRAGWSRKRAKANRWDRASLAPNLRVRRLEERRVLNADAAPVQALVVDAGTSAGDGHADTFVVEQHDNQVRITVNGKQVSDMPISQLGKISIQGSSDNDVLIAEFKSGEPLAGLNLLFDGKGGNDSLVLSGDASVNGVTHNFGDAGSNHVDIQSPTGTAAIAYSNVESVNDSLTAQSRTFSVESGGQQITLDDAGTSTDNRSQLDVKNASSDTQLSVVFNNPTHDLTLSTNISTDKPDTIALNGLDHQYHANTQILGSPDDLLVVHGPTNFGGGNVDLSAGTIKVEDSLTTSHANLDMHATNEILIGSSGSLHNDAGNIRIEAPNIELDGAIVAHGGQVHFDSGAGGTTIVRGSIDVTQPDASKPVGTVHILGSQVDLLDNAQIDATATVGAGTILIGGDYQGKNSAIRNALNTYIGSDVVILADAVESGNGGKVIVWADESTRFYGAITARGGANGGNGGFVETSGKQTLEAIGAVDASAPAGANGAWRIDPLDVLINAALAATIKLSLDAGTDVLITTNVAGADVGTIQIAAPIAKTAGGAATLTLDATTTITIDPLATITSTSGALNVIFNATVVNINAAGTAISSNGGNVTFNAPVVLQSNTSITTGAGAGDVVFTDTVNGDVAGRNLNVTAGTGNATFTGAVGAVQNLGVLTVTSANQATFGSTVRANDIDLTATTVRFTNNVTALTDDVDVNGNLVLLGNVIVSTGAAAGDDFTVTGTTNGDVAGRNLSVASGLGDATFTGAVGAVQNLGVLTVTSANQATFGSTVRANDIDLTATTVQFTNDVTALTDDVGVAGNLELLGNVVVTTGAGAGDDFSVTGTTNGDVAGRNLTIAAGLGNSTLTGAVGAVQNLGVLTVASAAQATFGSTVRANDVSLTATTVRFTNNVTALTDDVAVTGDLVLLGNVIVTTGAGASDDFTVSGTTNGDVAGRNLTIAAGLGNSTLTGAVGAVQNLGVLTVASAAQATFGSAVRANDVSLTATTVRFTNNVTALTDDVDVNGNLVLLGNVIVSTGAAAGDDFTVTGTTNGDVAGRNLSVTAGLGNATFTGAVGAVQNLGVLTVTSANQVTFGSTVRANDIDLTATTVQFANNVTALLDDVDVSGNLVLLGNVLVTTGGGAGDDFTVSGTTNGDVAGRNLTVTAGLGDATLTGAVGAVQNLGVLTVTSANQATFGSTVRANDIDLMATTVRFTNNVTALTDDVDVNGNLVLLGNVVVTTGALAGDDFSVTGTTTGDVAGRDLTVAAGLGNVTFTGAVGAVQNLGVLTVSSAAQATFGSTVRANDIDLTATTVRFTNNVTALTDDVAVIGDLVLLGNVIVTTGAGASDDFTVSGTTNGDVAGRNLTVTAGLGDATFTGAVGAIQNLGVLTVASAAQATFGSTVRANDVSLTATTVRFTNNVTALTDDVDVNGNLILLGNVVVTTGALATDDFTVTGTTNGDVAGRDLTVIAGLGDAALTGAVGAVQNLGVLKVTSANQATFGSTVRANDIDLTATTVRFTNNVTALLDDVDVNGNLVLLGNINVTTGSLAADDFTVTGTTNGDVAGRNLSVAAGLGGATLTGAVGAVQNLGVLTVTSANQATFGSTVRANDIDLTATTVRFTNNVTALTDDVDVDGNLVLLGNVIVSTGAAAGDDFTVTGTTNGDVAGRDFNVIAGVGNATITGAVGADQDLGLLKVTSANQATFGSTARASDIDLTATTVRLTDNVTALVDDVDVHGNLVLLGNVLATTGAGANDDFTVSGTTNGDVAGRNLTILAVLGNAIFTGDVGTGGGGVLGTLAIASANNATFNAAVSATIVSLANVTGAASFIGSLTAGTLLVPITVNNVNVTGSLNTITTDTTFNNFGFVTLGDQVGDSTTFIGGLSTLAAARTNVAGFVNTVNTHLDLGNTRVDTDASAISSGGRIGVGTIFSQVVNNRLILNASGVINGGDVDFGTVDKFTGAYLGQFSALTNGVGQLILNSPITVKNEGDLLTDAGVNVNANQIQFGANVSVLNTLLTPANPGRIVAKSLLPGNDLTRVAIDPGIVLSTPSGQIGRQILSLVGGQYTALQNAATKNLGLPQVGSDVLAQIQANAIDIQSKNLTITIDWRGGTLAAADPLTDRVVRFPLDGSADAVVAANAQSFQHQYSRAFPPDGAFVGGGVVHTLVFVSGFAQGTILFNVNGGATDVLTVDATGGIQAIVDVPFAGTIGNNALPTPQALPVQPAVRPVVVAPAEVAPAVETNIQVVVPITAGVTSAGEVRYYELRLVYVGEDGVLKEVPKGERINLNEDRWKAIYPFDPSKLPTLFGRLPADHYRIYLIEDGAERLILDFTIQQGQPIEIPEREATDPFIDEQAAPQATDAVPAQNQDNAERQSVKSGASNNGSPTKAADAFAERLGKASFLSHGGVIVGAAALAYSSNGRWEQSIDRLMERFDRRRRSPRRNCVANREQQTPETSSSNSTHNSHRGF